jgi:hypothetical protein
MSSRYANRVYTGRSFPNQSLRSATKLAARAFESNCVSGGVLILESKRPDTFYLPRRIEQIYFGKNDSLWSTNDKTTLILIFKIACCNCTLPAANLHYFRRCSCGATSSRLSRKIGWSTTAQSVPRETTNSNGQKQTSRSHFHVATLSNWISRYGNATLQMLPGSRPFTSAKYSLNFVGAD